MARPPRRKTPLRLMRESIGLAQKEFAAIVSEKLGIPEQTYRAYESGRRGMQRDVAVQLMLLYGVDPDSIMAIEGEPLDLARRPYSRFAYDNWPGERVYDRTQFVSIAERMLDRIIWTLLAARKAGHFTLGLHYLDEAVRHILENLDLGKVFVEIRGEVPKERSYRTVRLMTAWSPVDLYTAGAPVQIPETADFPLSKEARNFIEGLFEQRTIASGMDHDAYWKQHNVFFRGSNEDPGQGLHSAESNGRGQKRRQSKAGGRARN